MAENPRLLRKTLMLNQKSPRQTINVDGTRVFIGIKLTEANKWFIYLVHASWQGNGKVQVSSVHYILNNCFYLQMCRKQMHDKYVLFISRNMEPLVEPSTYQFELFISVQGVADDFIRRRIDSRLDDLWTSAIHRDFTDIEFRVGGSSFPAHKAIVAARSPVFYAMFRSDMIEARTNRVHIDDIEANTFETLLKFLYTGKVDDSAVDQKLLMAADKYQVETLRRFCQQVTTEDNMEQILLKIHETL